MGNPVFSTNDKDWMLGASLLIPDDAACLECPCDPYPRTEKWTRRSKHNCCRNDRKPFCEFLGSVFDAKRLVYRDAFCDKLTGATLFFSSKLDQKIFFYGSKPLSKILGVPCLTRSIFSYNLFLSLFALPIRLGLVLSKALAFFSVCGATSLSLPVFLRGVFDDIFEWLLDCALFVRSKVVDRKLRSATFSWLVGDTDLYSYDSLFANRVSVVCSACGNNADISRTYGQYIK